MYRTVGLSADTESFISADTDTETDISADTDIETDNILSLIRTHFNEY